MFSKIAILAVVATCAAASVTKTEAHQKAFNGSLVSSKTWTAYTTANHKSMASNKKLRTARALAVAAYFASRSANGAAWAANGLASGANSKAAAASAKAAGASAKAASINRSAAKTLKAAKLAWKNATAS